LNIIVTGAAGFIGSHLCEKLLSQNHLVLGIDNFDPFYDKRIKEKNLENAFKGNSFKLFEVDILEKSKLSQIFRENQIDLVIHIAAKAGVRPSIKDPIGYYNTNVIGTLNILEVMKENGCKKMIFASSSSVYGNNKKVPFSETDIVDNPISPYAASKKASELLCHTYHHLYGFDIFALRFFTVYGPRQRPDLAIHKFTKLLLEGKEIPFYGDGTSSRDYTYIDDIIDGIIGAVKKLHGFEIINIGNSYGVSLTKMINIIEEKLSKIAILKKMPMQAGDVKLTFADISKAKKILGYEPRVNFEIGIANFIKWYIENNL